MAHNVGSYTQGRIAGDFLSSRNAARAERCTPKTTAAAGVAEVISRFSLFVLINMCNIWFIFLVVSYFF